MREALLAIVVTTIFAISGAFAKVPSLVATALFEFPKPMISIERPVEPLNPGSVVTAKSDGLKGPVRSLTAVDYFRNSNGEVGDTPYNRFTAEYDHSGKMVRSYTNNNPTPSIYHYDKRGKFTHKTFKGKDTTKRDKKGRIIEGSDWWKYDSKGRVIYYRPVVDSCLNTHYYSYGYDSKGRITKYVYTSVDDNEHFTFADQVTRYRYTGNTIDIHADYGDLENRYQLTLDSKGRICKIVGVDWRDPKKPVTQVIFYDDTHNRPIGTNIYSEGKRATAILKYDSYGNWVEKKVYNTGGWKIDAAQTVKYQYDAHGNWTEKDDGGGTVMKRQITYYEN